MEYQPERALIHLLYDDYSLILRTVEIESQPERALILHSQTSCEINFLIVEIESQPERALIHYLLISQWRYASAGRNGVSARKGIDTNASSSSKSSTFTA